LDKRNGRPETSSEPNDRAPVEIAKFTASEHGRFSLAEPVDRAACLAGKSRKERVDKLKGENEGLQRIFAGHAG
jgi:hypothetical protein